MITTTIWAILAVFVLSPFALASSSSCEYSCHEKNEKGWELLRTPTALGWDSEYSIFECVYTNVENHKQTKRTCSYYKTDGKQAIGSAGDGCPTKAVECSSVEKPLFSKHGKYEIPPWIEHGRHMAYLMGHPIADTRTD